MPLEIRELIIKTTVDNNGGKMSGNGSGMAGGQADTQTQQENMVNICVEKVLEILKEKTER